VAQNGGKTWKRIGWLMLAGEVMLLLFLAQWLHSQYQVQEKRLHQDIKSLFISTEDKLTDSLLNRTIAIVLDNPHQGPRNVQVQVSTSSSDTTLLNDSFLKILPEQRLHHDMAMKKLRTGDTMHTTVKQMIIRSKSDKEQLPEDVKKILRLALVQTANSKDLYAHGFFASADSTTLFKTFQKELQKKQNRFIAHWDTTQLRDTGKLFHFKYGSILAPAVSVTGYHTYLLRSILPQIGFSLVLLLLIGLAFWLAYRIMKHQALFNRQKDSFISNISHELKTPVATTKVAIEALTTYNGIENPERTKKYLNLASWEMDRLSNMIDRIMNIIQTENGNLVLDKKKVNLTELVNELVLTQQPILTEKGIAVTWDTTNAVTILADKMHLQGVLYNLLDNAIKYGGNLIHIGIKMQEDHVSITVADNGPGIPVEYRKKIFENFFRIPSDDRHDVKGHGLGLSYARDIITAHDGTLELESVMGDGAVFVITLPINPLS
jgi:signal transduction histidine kinase